MTRRQKIWITRTQPGAEATAERVRAMGHEAIVAPLLEVRPIEDAVIDLADVAALAFTSANGVWAFAGLCDKRDLRVFGVGAATAQAARAAGFRAVLSANGDVAALAAGIAARRRELNGVVLHLGAAEPAGDLTGALEARGVATRQVILYATDPAPLATAELEVLVQADAVLLHSPRAAKALAQALKSRPAPELRALALSKAVMRPLARTPLAAKLCAPFPLEAELLNLINREP